MQNAKNNCKGIGIIKYSPYMIFLRRAFLTIYKSSIRPDLDYGDPFCSKIKVYSILQR